MPSPGASWARRAAGPTAKRRSKWVASALHGQVHRGTGILNNERYIGRFTWGRSRWKRGAADSSKRSATVVEDSSQWITHEDPRLRIVPRSLWDNVKARQAAISKRSENIRVARTGRRATSLLSGLLECDQCGAHFIAVDRNFYGCASYKQGGPAACANSARIKRDRVEELLLKEIMAEILSDEAVALAQDDIRAELRHIGTPSRSELPLTPKLASLDAQADEVRGMQRAGKLALAVAQAALDAIERQRVDLTSAARQDQRATAEVIRLLPQAADVYRAAVCNLNATLNEPQDRAEARALIGNLLGGRVKIRQEGAAVYAQLEMDAAVLLSAAANSSKFSDFKCGSGGPIWDLLSPAEGANQAHLAT